MTPDAAVVLSGFFWALLFFIVLSSFIFILGLGEYYLKKRGS